MNAQPQEEFCPRCGAWVDQLGERTGWCHKCSGPEPADGTICTRCHQPRPGAYYRDGQNYRGVCRQCRNAVRTAWRKAHPEREAENNKRKYLKRLAARAAQ